jgi:ribose transport system ATP-binding protein
MSAVLEVEGLSKTFARTRALQNVSLSTEPGEVHALLGQNGSGKSTLIKVLSGYHQPDYGGRVRIQGEDLPFQSPIQSYRMGCRFVQQDLGLVPTLSVLDNMAIGSGFPTRCATIRGRAAYKQAREDLERLSLDIDPRALVATLTASERTGVAVARALREDPAYPARLLVLDEPTATLPVDEVDHLLDRVQHMAATGVGVLYVTHHLGEVFRVAHKVTILRDGMVVGAGPVSDFDHAAIVNLLAGEELLAEETKTRQQKAARARARTDAPVFEVDQLRAGALAGLSLRVESGEIVGVAGLAGSGRDSVLGASFGALPRAGGEVKVAGVPLPAQRPDLAIARGVAYLAPDRKAGGAVMTMTARENFSLPQLKHFWSGLLIRRKAETARAKEWFERLSVRPAGAVNEPLSIFSGGNQQKVLFGKWLSQQPSVFLLDEPTQGVDVGAKADLHRELVAAAQQGAAVLVSSSDLEELADLCDRVLVIVDGQISSELSGDELTEGNITRRFMPIAVVPADAEVSPDGAAATNGAARATR